MGVNPEIQENKCKLDNKQRDERRLDKFPKYILSQRCLTRVRHGAYSLQANNPQTTGQPWGENVLKSSTLLYGKKSPGVNVVIALLMHV